MEGGGGSLRSGDVTSSEWGVLFVEGGAQSDFTHPGRLSLCTMGVRRPQFYEHGSDYRGTSLIRNSARLGHHRSNLPKDLWRS